MPRLVLFAIPVAITIYALIDVVMAPRDRVRTLPKWMWIVSIVVLTILGAILWFFLGRPRRASSAEPGRGPVPGYRRPVGPDDDPDFLAELERKKPETE